MNNDVWEYFFLTTEKSIHDFEYDRAVLMEQKFTKKVQSIIQKLKETNTNAQYDLRFLMWMTKDSMNWEMTKDISEKAQDYCLEHKSFNYLHSLLRNLFSYYNFFPQYRKYYFIKHGYPISLNFKLNEYSEYVVYKEYEEVYRTVKISDRSCIKEIMNVLSLSDMLINTNGFKVNSDSVLFLQYENE